MRVVTVFSTKGGVGKSTLSANLSVALVKRGHPCLVLDLDPQNGLSSHFFIKAKKLQGLANVTLQRISWRDVILPTESGVALLPFGDCSEVELEDFERLLEQDKFWLHQQLESLDLESDVVVIIDTPPGSSLFLRQALRACLVAVAVINPDAGSYATMPQFEQLLSTYCYSRESFITHGLIVNKVDQLHALSKDILRVLRAEYRDNLIGVVHTDQSVREALAHGQDVFRYVPESEAAQDIDACAHWLIDQLQLKDAS